MLKFLLGLFGSHIIFWLAGVIIWFVLSRINYLMKKRRGDEYWEKFWIAKRAEENERMRDPSYKAQKVWDEPQERYEEIQPQKRNN